VHVGLGQKLPRPYVLLAFLQRSLQSSEPVPAGKAKCLIQTFCFADWQEDLTA
jgi:hypothetical protein